MMALQRVSIKESSSAEGTGIVFPHTVHPNSPTSMSSLSAMYFNT